MGWVVPTSRYSINTCWHKCHRGVFVHLGPLNLVRDKKVAQEADLWVQVEAAKGKAEGSQRRWGADWRVVGASWWALIFNNSGFDFPAWGSVAASVYRLIWGKGRSSFSNGIKKMTSVRWGQKLSLHFQPPFLDKFQKRSMQGSGVTKAETWLWFLMPVSGSWKTCAGKLWWSGLGCSSGSLPRAHQGSLWHAAKDSRSLGLQ